LKSKKARKTLRTKFNEVNKKTDPVINILAEADDLLKTTNYRLRKSVSSLSLAEAKVEKKTIVLKEQMADLEEKISG